MAYTDIDNRVFYITQKEQQRNKIRNIKGAEPTSPSGNLRLRSGKLVYGLKYNVSIIKALRGKSKIKGGDGKFWKIKILNKGQSPFMMSVGKPKKAVMGKCKHRPSKHKFQGINRIPHEDLIQNYKRRKQWN